MNENNISTLLQCLDAIILDVNASARFAQMARNFKRVVINNTSDKTAENGTPDATQTNIFDAIENAENGNK